MSAVVYLNGEFVAETQAQVSVFDSGWLHGAGLFETMRAENGRVFRLESHIERLRRSAEKLLRPVERDRLPSRVDVLDLLERNGLKQARVRLTVTAGHMLVASEGEPALTVCLTAAPLAAPPASVYQQGVGVVLCDHRLSPSNPLAGHKTTSYLLRLLGLRAARQANCLEALWFTTRNHLAEGCLSNVFVVRDGAVRTPPLDTPVLPGITRAAILSLVEGCGFRVEECVLSVDDLLDADEVFLTNVIMQVVPVVRVERKDIATGSVGRVTKTMMGAFRDLVQRECGEV